MSDLQKSVDLWLDGEPTDEAHATLNDRLKASRQDALEFARQVMLDSLLREQYRRHARGVTAAPESSPPVRPRMPVPPQPRQSRTLVWAAVSLGVIALFTVGVFAWRGGRSAGGMPPGVAALIDRESTAVEAAGFADGLLYPGARLRFNRGQMLLRFGEEATVALTGDADLEVQSTRRAILHRGQVTATVTESGRGFTIGTPKGDVVDLGTRFGVNVRADRSSEIVVFDGEVNVHDEAASSRPEAPPRRLLAGEAIRLQDAGTTTRIPLIWQQPTLSGLIWSTAATPDRSSPISRVTDNLSNGSRPKFYAVSAAGFVENARAHVDRPYVWTGPNDGELPSELREGDYIQTFCDDKIRANLQITVGLSAPAHVYVLFDSRITTLPGWLMADFVKTPLEVVLKGDVVGFVKRRNRGPRAEEAEATPGKLEFFSFAVWKRDVRAAGDIRLGPVSPTPSTQHSMYGVVVVRSENGATGRSK